MRCLFVVQGEGRGHLTQALALRAMLARAGHEVCSVLVGRNPRRAVPAFFLDKIDAPVAYIESPNFVCDKAQRSIRSGATLWHAARHAAEYRASLGVIDAQLDQYRPDVVINFFEPVAGLYYGLYRPRVPMVCIAHQYLFLHPGYVFPETPAPQREALKAFARLTSWRATRRLALSLEPREAVPQRRLAAMPPLLRDELFAQPRDRQEPFLLAYLLNSGYADALKRWHARHPHIELHCFWDRAHAPTEDRINDTLTFHQLHDERFLHLMAQCSGLITTAGFESVSEAMYLGKPVLMVPVEGHFEQQCNAVEAATAGAGLASTRFDIDRLLDFLPGYRSPAPAFRAWIDTAETKFIREIEQAAHWQRTAIVEMA